MRGRLIGFIDGDDPPMLAYCRQDILTLSSSAHAIRHSGQRLLRFNDQEERNKGSAEQRHREPEQRHIAVEPRVGDTGPDWRASPCQGVGPLRSTFGRDLSHRKVVWGPL